MTTGYSLHSPGLADLLPTLLENIMGGYFNIHRRDVSENSKFIRMLDKNTCERNIELEIDTVYQIQDGECKTHLKLTGNRFNISIKDVITGLQWVCNKRFDLLGDIDVYSQSSRLE